MIVWPHHQSAESKGGMRGGGGWLKGGIAEYRVFLPSFISYLNFHLSFSRSLRWHFLVSNTFHFLRFVLPFVFLTSVVCLYFKDWENEVRLSFGYVLHNFFLKMTSLFLSLSFAKKKKKRMNASSCGVRKDDFLKAILLVFLTCFLYSYVPYISGKTFIMCYSLVLFKYRCTVSSVLPVNAE